MQKDSEEQNEGLGEAVSTQIVLANIAESPLLLHQEIAKLKKRIMMGVVLTIIVVIVLLALGLDRKQQLQKHHQLIQPKVSQVSIDKKKEAADQILNGQIAKLGILDEKSKLIQIESGDDLNTQSQTNDQLTNEDAANLNNKNDIEKRQFQAATEKDKSDSIARRSYSDILRIIENYSRRRIAHYSNYSTFYTKNKNNNIPQALKNASLTEEQFLNSIELVGQTGQYNNSESADQAFKKELEYYSSNYHIETYKELPFCLVVPTFKNFDYLRYYYNLHSIVQQNYSNYHVVIVDDASIDGTAEAIQYQLQKLSPQLSRKVKFIKNARQKGHMNNIYTAVTEHCKDGEIFMIVDGDDQLIGRQVLKLFNSVYHQTKALSIYSNHLRVRQEKTIMVGISLPYPQNIIDSNSFRSAFHYYSHLKSSWVDLFKQIEPSYLKDKQGHWFTNAVDNAIFFSLFELSCKRILYLPEFTYKYNYLTGNNVYKKFKFQSRFNTSNQIKDMKPLKCIKQLNSTLDERIERYFD